MSVLAKKFSISWHVECAKAIWFIAVSGSERPAQGQELVVDVVIWTSTTFKLKIEKTNGGFAILRLPSI